MTEREADVALGATHPRCQSEDQGGHPGCDLPATLQTKSTTPRMYFCRAHRERFYRPEDIEPMPPSLAMVAALEEECERALGKADGIALVCFDADTAYRKRLEDALGMKKTNWWTPLIDEVLARLEKSVSDLAGRCSKCRGSGSIPNGTDEMACGTCGGTGALRAAPPAASVGGPTRIHEFVEAVIHGDTEHRRWLRNAAIEFLGGNPVSVPPPSPPSHPTEAEREHLEFAAKDLAARINKQDYRATPTEWSWLMHEHERQRKNESQ